MKTTFKEITVKNFLGLALINLLLAGGCAVKGYNITPLLAERFPATDTVDVIRKEPGRPYEILAEFIGHEPAGCPETVPVCTLRNHGKDMGAHAVWIQEHIKTEQPGDWILVNNKMTKIHPYTVETYRGVFIRYLDDQSR